MAANNLRIIYADKVSTIAGSATHAAKNNLKSDTAAASSSYSIALSSGIAANAGIMVFVPEYTGSLTMTISSPSTTVYAIDVGINTSTTIGYGGGKYIAAYIPGGIGTSFTITLSQSVKVAKIIVGTYWSPTFNTQFGLSISYDDKTSVERTQAGDLYTINAPRNKTMSFDMNYMNEADKFKFFDIIKASGRSKPIFVSAFPHGLNTDTSLAEKEQMYSICGIFSNMPGITHSMWTIYAASVQVEEI